MSSLLRVLLVVSCAAAVGLVPAGVAEACFFNRAYTSSYCDPCVSYPTVARSYFVPAPIVTPVVTSSSYFAPPTCAPVQRCYLEPQTTYITRTQLEPYVGYARRCYFDPFTGCSSCYLEPVTQYVARNYLLPVTSYVQRCQTDCPTPCPTPCATGSCPTAPAAPATAPGAITEQYMPQTSKVRPKAPLGGPVVAASKPAARQLSTKSGAPIVWSSGPSAIRR